MGTVNIPDLSSIPELVAVFVFLLGLFIVQLKTSHANFKQVFQLSYFRHSIMINILPKLQR